MMIKFGYKMILNPLGYFDNPYFFVNTEKKEIVGSVKRAASSWWPNKPEERFIEGNLEQDESSIEIRHLINLDKTTNEKFSIKIGKDIISGVSTKCTQNSHYDVVIEGKILTDK